MDYGAREMIRIISKAAAGHSHAVQKSCFVFKDNFLSIYKRESEYRTQLKNIEQHMWNYFPTIKKKMQKYLVCCHW